MAKKLKKSESVVVDVDNDVTSVSCTQQVDAVDGHCGLDSVAEAINEKPSSEIKRKSSSAKKVSDVALLSQISDMEKALENAKVAIESAAADNERLADELSTSVVENKSLRKELSKLKQDYKKMQGDNRANGALIETMNDELTRLKVRNKELTDTIGRLQGKIKEYADEITEKERTIHESNFDIVNLDGQVSDLSFKVNELESKLAVYESMGFWKRAKNVFVRNKK